MRMTWYPVNTFVMFLVRQHWTDWFYRLRVYVLVIETHPFGWDRYH